VSRIALRLALMSVVMAAAVPSLVLAQSRVGVTSASAGDPRGKPPAQAERVLHVGVDVQANEVVRTGANDRAHLLFLDGSSLTVGPQARLTIDRFVYDPNTKTGDLAITASQGVLRFVGGKISKKTPVTVTTPSSTLTIRGGIMIVDVSPARTVATFVFGKAMTVQSQGQLQTVARPGWQVATVAGQAPGPAAKAPAGSLTGTLGQLEASAPAQSGGGATVDEQLANSGFTKQNSELALAPAAGGPNQQAANAAANAVNQAGTQAQQIQKPLTETKPPQPPPAQPPGQFTFSGGK
jgi:hypothetical protein